MSSSDNFLRTLRQGLERCSVRNATVLIAVSGGADSVALMRGLLTLRDEFALALRTAHLNHGLRGAASDADAAWVSGLCQKHQIPVVVGDVDLAAAAGESLPGIEELARNARLTFLERVATGEGCSVVATAHTADDQAETVLHHVLRGTGLSGLRGIPRRRTTKTGIVLARPMLEIRRSEVESYLQEIGQDYRTDQTNSDLNLTRNWLRHQLLPEIRQRMGNGVDRALTRLANQVAEVEPILTGLAVPLLDRIRLDQQPGIVRLNTRPLVGETRYLIREAFRTLWQQQQWPEQQMGFSEWNRLAEVALVGGEMGLPGKIRARHAPAGLLVLEKTDQ